MTGRLHAIGRILSSYANDLDDANATPEEREVSAILTAVNAAILLRATSSLAGVVGPWWGGQGIEAVRVISEQRRVED